MTVNLSTEIILENIYAASALYAVTQPAGECPPLLHRDHRAALLLAIDEAFSLQILDLMPYVTDYDISDEILSLTFADDFATVSNSPANLLQAIVTARTLAAVWLNFDIERSSSYRARADAATATLLALANRPSRDLHIIPEH